MMKEYSPEVSKWQVVWPVYFMKDKTREEGRAMAKDKCPDNVTVDRLARAAISLGLNVCVEREKRYPRDAIFLEEGRVRVELHRDGAAVKENIPNKRVLLRELAAEVPKLTSIKAKEKEKAVSGKGAAEGAGAAPAKPAATSSGAARKRRGKKR